MFRDVTFSDLNRAECFDGSAEFVLDEEAFRDFYDRTARGLWGYLARVTGDRHQADDLFQETFYRFLRANTAYESESHRRNSLYRIATNLACDARRHKLRHPDAAVSGEEIESLGGAADGSEKRAEVNAALARLNPRERAMLWLAYAEGASHEEIAGALGLRTGSMKILLFRARRKLAALLGGRR